MCINSEYGSYSSLVAYAICQIQIQIQNEVQNSARSALHHAFQSCPLAAQHCDCLSYNEKSDIWSLGCMLYETCALKPPFTAFSQRELAIKISAGGFQRIPYRYSDELQELISSMLVVNVSNQ